VRGGPLSDPAVLKLLRPFVVTSWHGVEATMTREVKEVFGQSEVAKPPRRSNTFMLLLDPQGRLVHGFHGLSGRGVGRSDYKVEVAKGLAKLKLPEGKTPDRERVAVLPDLKGAVGGVPAGVRIFLRHQGRRPVVEVVPMGPEGWKALAFPEREREIEPETLRSWLVQLYPPAIRTVDQRKPFQKVTGRLKLVPAGADKNGRYALLSGEVRLAKGDEKESAFEGAVQAVLTYRPDAPEVRSVRGVVEGDYVYRIRGTQRLPLKVAIESRPE
jgi:hypothetical protein